MMRLTKSQPDAPRYNEGRRTRSRASTRRPQDESISESANAISIETMTVLSSNTEIAQLRRGLTDRPFSGTRRLARQLQNTLDGRDATMT